MHLWQPYLSRQYYWLWLIVNLFCERFCSVYLFGSKAAFPEFWGFNSTSFYVNLFRFPVLALAGIFSPSSSPCIIASKINVTPKDAYLLISKLHSILAVANLLAHNNISQICYCGQISLPSAAVNCSFPDNLKPLGVPFILLVMVQWQTCSYFPTSLPGLR